MPTGYTADVQNGKVTDFRTFALRCARAFGACVTQRDDPMDAAPQRCEVSEHSVRYRAEALARVVELEAIGPEEMERAAEAAFADALGLYNKWGREQTEERARYESMLAYVEAWTPPTPEHVALKDFMEKQLRESMRFDHYQYPYPPRLTGPQWLAKEREKAASGLSYAEKSLREEQERCSKANAWIDALVQSLGAA